MIEFSLLCLEKHKLQNSLPKLLPLVDSVHLDIMDGEFVPVEAFSTEFISEFRTDLPKHVHVMSYDPLHYLDRLQNIDSFTFHFESVDNHSDIIDAIHKKGFQAGLCVNPETPVSKIAEYLPDVDRILLMAVNPGYSGQKYIQSTSEKIIRLRQEAPDLEIVIDGGMHENTIREVMTLGANACVVCSVIVQSPDWASKVSELKAAGEIGYNNNIILNN
ncbi:MAG: ribulose-phosphate 3-epimerase [Desulfobacter sp.]|nr:MAG: ribulose-phosphate 3-epimerase [Desulfobacter sp.]